MKHKIDVIIPAPTSGQFPLLARSSTKGQIVRFTSENEGTLVSPGESDLTLFRTTDTWISCFETGSWTILPKGTKLTVELVQE